jgi:hypothetical protein
LVVLAVGFMVMIIGLAFHKPEIETGSVPPRKFKGTKKESIDYKTFSPMYDYEKEL